MHDVTDALAALRPTYDNSHGSDGFVSIEVAPELARDTAATIAAAARLHERIARPNLLVKIPATAEGIRAIEATIGRGLSIYVTLIFSLSRYEQVIEAHLRGLETLAARGGVLAAVRRVASSFVSRVDTEVDTRLEQRAVATTSQRWRGWLGAPTRSETVRPQSRVDLREAFNLAMHSSGSTNGSSLADRPFLRVPGCPPAAAAWSSRPCSNPRCIAHPTSGWARAKSRTGQARSRMTRSRPTICLLSADSEAIGSDSAASSGSNPIRLKTSVASTAPRSNG